MNTEFSIFRVIAGKESRAQEWMKLLIDRRADCIETLEREAMFYESVFQKQVDGRLYLAWFSVQGKSGQDVESSTHPIDELHLLFWKECIDTSWKSIDMEHVVSFFPEPVDQALGAWND